MARDVTVRLGDGVAAAPGLDAAGRRLIARAARAALREHDVADAEISIALLSDEDIASLNGEYLEHDGPTDVISFALYEEGEDVVGDIYIGVEQAARQADSAGVPLPEELVRLAVHGTLHVLGHDHPEGEGRLRSEMWRVQEEIVAKVVA